MIDLDGWEREQLRANQHAADMAMWRLGRRYGWDIPHPTVQLVVSAQQDLGAKVRVAMVAYARILNRAIATANDLFAPPDRGGAS